MADGKTGQKLKEALHLLAAIGMPAAQQNERTALTLLSLADMTPEKDWSDAERPMLGITPMMDWFREHYGKDYKPNTRETIKRIAMVSGAFCEDIGEKAFGQIKEL